MRINEIFESEQLVEFDKRHIYYEYQIAKNPKFQKVYAKWKKSKNPSFINKIMTVVSQIVSDTDIVEYFVNKIRSGKFDLEKALNPSWKQSNDQHIQAMRKAAAADKAKHEPQTVYKPKPERSWPGFLQPAVRTI